MLLRGPEYIGAKHSRLIAEQRHLSYHMTRANGYSEALGASSSKRLSRRHSRHNHVHAPVEMPIISSNRGHIGSSDGLLHLSFADMTPRRRGQSQDDRCPPPRYGRLDVKLYIRLTVLQSLLERMESRYGNTTTKWPQSKTISEKSSGRIWQIRYSFSYVEHSL